MRPPRAVRSAWARLPSSSPAPPGSSSGEVVLLGAAVSGAGAGAGFSVFPVEVVLGGGLAAVSLGSLSPPQPDRASTAKVARKPSPNVKRRGRFTDGTCEEMHNGLDTLDTR